MPEGKASDDNTIYNSNEEGIWNEALREADTARMPLELLHIIRKG
jgi:hypothetical protein